MDQHEGVARATIRSLNDRLRTAGIGGNTHLTRAVASLSPAKVQKNLDAVRAFDAFTPPNDPWGEHDFGAVSVEGQTYFWKIDAYDIDCQYASPDPTDETITRRVLTIMAPEDF